MKTTPRAHQVTGGELLAANPYYMLGCDMGTGKTWMLMDDAEKRFLSRQIEALLVIAPNGVHTNWVKREIPAHMSVPTLADYYTAGMGKRRTKKFMKLFESLDDETPPLRVMCLSIDSINTKTGFTMAYKFLRMFRCIIVLDESHNIKHPTSKRTERCLRLSQEARIRRCASGTPFSQGPADIFCQFEFLRPGLLGTVSYRAFAAEYTQMLPPNNRMVVSVIERKHPNLVRQWREAVAANQETVANELLRKMARLSPQIAATDIDGKPKHRNLDKLSKLIAPYMYRVTKAECLSLPEKIYTSHYFELSAAQRAAYDFVNENMRWEREDGEFDFYTALTKGTKLQQITSGFMMGKGGEFVYHEDDATARLLALAEIIEGIEGKFIIWARYREEIRSICRMLADMGIPFVEYHGGVKKDDRENAVDSLQTGDARAFVGNATSGGVGLTLTAAETVIYYSNDFNMVTRNQSEDRAHRMGTVRNVLYIDLVAVETVDEQIALALQTKEEVAAILLRDAQRGAIK